MNQKKRYIFNQIQEDALNSFKIAMLSGPRQIGKTTLAKELLASAANYYTWDDDEFRKQWSKSAPLSIEQRDAGPIVLDEVHKDKRWKQKLKGIYDTVGSKQQIIVTGSARLDLYRKGSDSLMGRYIPYRLHPFSVAECEIPVGPQDILQMTEPKYKFEDLLALGGFPEPLFGGSEAKAQRWSRLRLDRLINEDARDLQMIREVNTFRVFVELMMEQVGSLLSINSLRENSGVAYGTAYAWTQVLEALYFCFMVRPYAGKLRRTLTAQPKLYLFDILRIKNQAQRYENLVALHLLKAVQYWTDVALGEFHLHFIQNKDGGEVDFCIVKDGAPWMLVECKSNKEEPHKNLIHFSKSLGTTLNFQLISKSNYRRDYAQYNIAVLSRETFLAGLV